MKKLTDPNGALADAKAAYTTEVTANSKYTKAARTLAAEYLGKIREMCAEQGVVSPP